MRTRYERLFQEMRNQLTQNQLSPNSNDRDANDDLGGRNNRAVRPYENLINTRNEDEALPLEDVIATIQQAQLQEWRAQQQPLQQLAIQAHNQEKTVTQICGAQGFTIPNELRCPISQSLIRGTVVRLVTGNPISDKYYYDKNCIDAWAANPNLNNRHPITNEHLTHPKIQDVTEEYRLEFMKHIPEAYHTQLREALSWSANDNTNTMSPTRP